MKQTDRCKAISDTGALYVLWATTYSDVWIRQFPHVTDDNLDQCKNIYSFMKLNGAGVVLTDCPTPSTTFTTAEAAEAARTRHIEKLQHHILNNLSQLPANIRAGYIQNIEGEVGILQNAIILKLAATEVTV